MITGGLDPNRRLVGIDVGGTKSLGVAMVPTADPDNDVAWEVTVEERRLTPRGDGSVEELVDALASLARSLCGGLDPGNGQRVTIGIGVPGLVDRRGVLRAAPNLDGVADFEIARRVGQRLGTAVHVDNDGTCATLAEWRLGAARDANDAVLITLGTGIGGGLVSNGRLQRGANGFAGEFGHMVIDPDGPRCPCGRRGCWERYASGSGLAMLAREAATGRRLRHVVELAGGDPQAVRGEHVYAAAQAGDPEALAVIDDFARFVALGLSNLTNALDPEVFVLGGGLAVGAEIYLEPIQTWFRQLLYQPHLRP
ncbi:MAG: ROK family protein, partial [Actinomycetota bacterium]